MMTYEQIRATGAAITLHQFKSGEIPWWHGYKADPWNCVHAAMGLTVAGYHRESAAAFRFLARTQNPSGAWPSERVHGRIVDDTQETNQAAYIATGVWHTYVATRDTAFVAEMWPTVERAIEFVTSLQDETGSFCWSVDGEGNGWRDPLLTGSSSIHGSLVSAIRIAELLGYDRPDWYIARERVAQCITTNIERFDKVDLPDPPGRFSMDWYYPVLGGAMRGDQGRERLLDEETIRKFVAEGYGIRCVLDSPWYTVAESCELVLALDAVGLENRAREIFSWMGQYRMDDGGYWIGKVMPKDVYWPGGQATWTAAAVIIADDALKRESATSAFFRSLGGDGLVPASQAIAS